MLPSCLEYLFGLLQRERPSIAKNIHEMCQLLLGGERNHTPDDFLHISLRVGMPFSWDDMRSQEGGNEGPGPLLCRVADRFQALDLRISIKAVARLRLQRGGTLPAHLL